MKKTTPDIMSAVANNIFELILFPTEQCNFRCTYCYEDFEIGAMPESVVTGVKRLIEKRVEELDVLKVEWFGGEPLANLPTVLDISHHAQSLAERHDCRFVSGMTTNAYLLKPSTFDKLISAGVRDYQVSLDGPEALHNKTRLRADGAGTFERIWHNLECMAASRHQFHVMLRVHVTPDNYDHLPDLIEKINTTFMDDSRFSVFLKAIANLGGPNAGQFATLKGQSHKNIMQYLSSLLKTQEVQIGAGEPYICYASKANSLVVRADGKIGKCTVALSDERNTLGHIKEDGTVSIDNGKLQPWLRGLLSKNTHTLSCPWHGLPEKEKQSSDPQPDLIPVVAA